MFNVDPDRLTQFGSRSPAFCLVTEADREKDFEIAPTELYASSTVVALGPGQTLGSAMCDGLVPEAADVLVVCPDRFLSSPDEDAVGRRRIAVLPFLDVLYRSDVARQEKFCAELADALDGTADLRLQDRVSGTAATFQVSAGYEWNQQAGFLETGEQQVAPSGEFSALPTHIDSYDATRRLGLTGSLTVLGPPIVHRADRAGLLTVQKRLFEGLDTTRSAPMRLDVEDGVITDWRALDPAAEPAVEALFELFDENDLYRIVWEFGIGCNDAIEPQPGNCGMNEMYGSEAGVLHIGMGLTPTTDYAITLSCRQTTGYDSAGRRVFGIQSRINRTRSADCGCIG
jgi:hypothetical protein